MTAARNRKGFTLVELVAAVTVTALLAGATVTVVRSTAAARRVADKRLDTRRQAILAADTIASAIRNAWMPGIDATKLLGLDDLVDGMPSDRLRLFVASDRAVRAGTPEADVMEVEFRLVEGDGKRPAGVWERIDPTRNEGNEEGGVAFVVAENVIALDISYHDGQQWHGDWPDSRSDAPLAIRIEVAVEDPDGRAQGSPEICAGRRIIALDARRNRATQ